ncbi:uncharacterized protein K02A2.6-like [Lytechinus pictus]|uniref:uncharacterized protein K02A2.6-like n=1 Tax=Lytechinus pictus TaxID=7653 RepID=UPI0030BA16A6
MKKESCPAWGQKCKACSKPNNFKGSSVCKTRNIHHVGDDDYSSSAERISFVQINAVDMDKEQIICNMLINNQRVPFQLDSGATVNLLPQKYLKEEDVVQSANIRLSMWNKATTQAIGKCKVITRNPATGKKYKVEYIVVKEDLPPLLSKTTGEKMQIITVHYDSLELVRSIVPKDIAEISPDKYPDVFSSSSIGTLPGSPVHLTVTDDAMPTVCPARIIPESLKGKVKDALDDLQAKDIIEEVSSPTDWVIFYLSFSDATVFSICDLKDGYLHCKLDEESSLLTTFATPWARYRWKRLPFGLKFSSEIFQKRLHQALDGLSGVRCVADDIIIWGNSDAEHDARLYCLLKRCQAVGIVLNKEKCQFRLKEISFLGHIVSNSGLKPNPSKIEAILNMSDASCKDDIHRLRGMVNYLSRYLPKLSDVIIPLNEPVQTGRDSAI